MSLVEMKWSPKDKELRQFGWICLFGLPFVAWMFSGRPMPSAMTPTTTKVIIGMAVAGAAMALLATVRPQLLKWIYIALMLLMIPIGFVITEVMFLLMYYLVFTPVALVFKLMGRDSLQRKFDKTRSTYWEPKIQPAHARRYFRQY